MDEPLHESQLPPILFEHHMCALLGIAPSTLRAARKRRTWIFSELPKMGRKPRWSRDQVLAAINRHQLTKREQSPRAAR